MARTTMKKKGTRKALPRKPARRAVARKPVKRATSKKRGAAPARKASGNPKDGAAAMRALARRIIDLSLGGDDEAILALYADDVASSEAGRPADVGKDALRAKFAGWRSMTTDTAFEPRRVVVDGNVIVIEWVGRVTLAASGRQAELHEVAVHEIRNGKIVREAFFYDPAALA